MADDAIDASADAVLHRRVVEARPVADQLARSVLRARVSSALFGDATTVTVGRYRLGRQLGRGGGGAVFVAEDPELRRDVAVKLIRCASARTRERALAEGRALARLAHPNVVAVHDVGESGEHVYLVMELLRGNSLREFSETEHTLRTIVDAYRQAAMGLAAAHAAGVVHRDFKPENAMFGEDRRLRVVDFGLAMMEGDDAARVGTPRYMAPEQHTGETNGTAVDQYALAASLREAVTSGDRRLPVWLSTVLARAMAEDPAGRYPSMDALASALGNDPRLRWRKRFLVAVPIALAAVGFGIGRTASQPSSVCNTGAELLDPDWTMMRVDTVARHVEGLGTPFALAAAPWVRERLEALGHGWLDAHRTTCQANEHGDMSGELRDRATLCLARARIGLGQVMTWFEASSPANLEQALAALSVVPAAGACADPVQLAGETNPQPTLAMLFVDQQIEAAAMHARASTADAVPFARSALSAATRTGDKRLIARASLVLGHSLMAVDRAQAIAPLHAAVLLGTEEGLDDVATEGFARRAWSLARKRDPDLAHALDGLELAEALGRRAGERGRFARALLANNAGSVAQFQGNHALAREMFRRALAESAGVVGPGAVELQTIVSNLALLTIDRRERTELFARALRETVAAVGPDHPQAFEKRLLALSDDDNAEIVVAELTRTSRDLERLHPQLGQLRLLYSFEIAWQASALEKRDVVAELAQSVPAAEPAWLRDLLLAYVALNAGDSPKKILRRLQTIAAERATLVPRNWFQNQFAADAELAVAYAARRAGDNALARAAATRAASYLEVFRSVTGVPSGSIQRRLDWAHAMSAR